jgi:hypothetical protein
MLLLKNHSEVSLSQIAQPLKLRFDSLFDEDSLPGKIIHVAATNHANNVI